MCLKKLTLLTTILCLGVLTACQPQQTLTTTPTVLTAPTAAPANTSAPVATAALPPGTETFAAPGATITLTIVSDLPMTGDSLVDTQAIVNAEQLRLKQAQGQACGGKYKIDFQAWDDSSATTGQWDSGVETANAKKAAADPSVVVYLGTYNSDAAKLSIPILNQAGPLVMISPANTYPGLTKPGEGSAGEPDQYYPSQIRNYARVITADDVQGTVAAHFVAEELKLKTVYVLDDKEPYGQSITNAFVAAARQLGLTVVGQSSVDQSADDFTALMHKIGTSNSGQPPDAIYAGLQMDHRSPELFQAKVAILGDNSKVKLIGPDGIQTQWLLDNAGASTTAGIYATAAGLPLDQLPPAGLKFVQDYTAQYGQPDSGYAVYGYEAMSAALQAIENVCAAGGNPADRRAVRDAVFSLKDFNGVLGTWSFDANGDTTLTDMTIYVVKDGRYQTFAVSGANTITALP